MFPITKGHTLVIPKKHSRNIFDCDPETAANIGRVLPKIANAVKEAYGCDGEISSKIRRICWTKCLPPSLPHRTKI